MPFAEAVVITVEYGNPSDTAALLQSLTAVERKESIEVVIVDNSTPTTATEQRIVDHDFPVRRIEPGTNLYYWGGAALALQSISFESGDSPSWVIICNNDIAFTERDFFSTLLSLDPCEHPIVAPSIISNVTGLDQNPMLRTEPGPIMRLRWRIYDTAYPVAKLMLAMRPAMKRTNRATREPALKQIQTIYAPHGSCVALSSEFFRRGGELDTAVPLYAEELTLAVLAQQLGVHVSYVPQLRVMHREHSTTGNTLTRAKYHLERKARKRFYELRAQQRANLRSPQ